MKLGVRGVKDGGREFMVKGWENGKVVESVEEGYGKGGGKEKKGKEG